MSEDPEDENEDDSEETDSPIDHEFDLQDLEDEPDVKIDNPSGEIGAGEISDKTNFDSPIEEALSGTPRVLQDGKENRKAVTAYINPMLLYEIADLQTQLSRELTPDPRKLDVYAAIFYAGLPTTDKSMRKFLREFGYRDENES